MTVVKVLYGDTDSVMIQTDIPLTNLMKDLNNSFNDFARRFGVENKTLHMKFEKEYDAWIQLGSKKRYIGSVDGKLDYKGIELRRSDNSDYTQWAEEEYFKKLFLTSKDDYTQGKKASMEFYKQELMRFDQKDESLIPLIGIWQSVKSDLNYAKRKYWVAEAVKNSINNYKLSVDVSMGRVKIYYIKKGEAIAINVDAELPKKFYKILDYDYHKARCLTNPLEEFVKLVTPEYQGFNAMETVKPGIIVKTKETSKQTNLGMFKF